MNQLCLCDKLVIRRRSDSFCRWGRKQREGSQLQGTAILLALSPTWQATGWAQGQSPPAASLLKVDNVECRPLQLEGRRGNRQQHRTEETQAAGGGVVLTLKAHGEGVKELHD
jgi:hypothetical protein